MSIFQLIAGVTCASGILFFMWRIALLASRYMIRHTAAPAGLRLLTPEPSGVRIDVSLESGKRLPVWHRGSGHAVLILPESGFKASAYTPLWSFLCGYGFKVILPDTGLYSELQSPEALASVIKQISRRLSVRSMIIVGHGFGVYQAISAESLLRHQEGPEVTGLVSVSGFSGITGKLSRSPFEKIFHRTPSYSLHVSAFGEEASAAGVLALQQHTTSQAWSHLNDSWNPVCSFYSEGFPEWPMKVLSSIHDGILPFTHSGALSEISSNAEWIHVRDGAGHMLIWEKPTLIVDQVRMIEKETKRTMGQTG